MKVPLRVISYLACLGACSLILFIFGLACAQVDPKDSENHSITRRSREVSLQTMLQELRSSPQQNYQREQVLSELFAKAGAEPNEMRFMDVVVRGKVAGRNLIVTKRGESKAAIVIGAHLDKVEVGQGVIDDWSGCILIKNLYQALRSTRTRHTIYFVGFALEEQGLLGSRQYVAALKRNEGAIGQASLRDIKAMVNFECLGVGGPFIWTNGSEDRLEAFAHRIANERKLELADHVITGVSADSMPFDREGVPTITFDGLPLEKLGLIHSPEDRFENIRPDRYQAAYRLGLEFVKELDGQLAGQVRTIHPLLPVLYAGHGSPLVVAEDLSTRRK